MDERKKLDIMEGDAANIILNPQRRVCPDFKPAIPPIQQVQEDCLGLEIEKPLSPDQKKKKLKELIAAALVMSRNKSFPEAVRARFLDKVAKYEKELSTL